MGSPKLLPRQPEIIFDLSRLLSRVNFSAPTGVDRVEMAYARGLLEVASERLSFAAAHPCGVYGRLPTKAVAAFLDETSRIWRGERPWRRTAAERCACGRPPDGQAHAASWRARAGFARSVPPVAFICRHRPITWIGRGRCERSWPASGRASSA